MPQESWFVKVLWYRPVPPEAFGSVYLWNWKETCCHYLNFITSLISRASSTLFYWLALAYMSCTLSWLYLLLLLNSNEQQGHQQDCRHHFYSHNKLLCLSSFKKIRITVHGWEFRRHLQQRSQVDDRQTRTILGNECKRRRDHGNPLLTMTVIGTILGECNIALLRRSEHWYGRTTFSFRAITNRAQWVARVAQELAIASVVVCTLSF